MAKKDYILLIALFIIVGIASSQQRRIDSRAGLIFAGGISWSGNYQWYYSTVAGNTAPLYPGISGSVGLEVGPIVHFKGMLIYPSIEISFGEEHSRRELATGNYIEAGTQRMPVMVFGKFVSESELSPFLRIGAGAAKTDIKEIASYIHGPNYRFHRWNFCWSVGGGFNYQLFPSMSVEMFLDEWISMEKITKDFDGYEFGVFNSMAFASGGIRMIYSPE